ncbi:MAG TPA: hypothetical protein DIV39_07735 [Verrucomicrobiales bacterium]|nr:hypothetical protein [Verrucomicrobiales bacterium]
MRTKQTSKIGDSLSRGLRAGFTLVEIMAVMMVIAILLSVAAVGIQNIDRGQATTTALSVTEALFDEARSAAVGRGTRARILIHKELNDSELDDRDRYLSYMCVAVESTDREGDVEGAGWEVITRGTKLPSGVYFSPEESDRVADAIGVGKPGTMRIDLPGKDSNGADSFKECYYFEFNPEGVCVDGEDAGMEPGAAVVLISGTRPRDQEEPKLMKNNKVGFVVWRNGRTSIFRSPEQIDLAQ